MQIIVPEGEVPLYMKIKGDAFPAYAFIELRPEDEILTAGYQRNGAGAPKDLYFDRMFRWQVPAQISGETLEELLENIRPLAERIIEGYEKCWRENKKEFFGQLTADAQEAAEKIAELCQEAKDAPENHESGTCEEWLAGFSDMEDVWPAGQSLEENVAFLKQCMAEEHFSLSGNIKDALLDRLIFELEEREWQATPEQAEALLDIHPRL